MTSKIFNAFKMTILAIIYAVWQTFLFLNFVGDPLVEYFSIYGITTDFSLYFMDNKINIIKNLC